MLDDKEGRIRVVVPNVMGGPADFAAATYHAFFDPAAGNPKPDDGRAVEEGLRADFVWPAGKSDAAAAQKKEADDAAAAAADVPVRSKTAKRGPSLPPPSVFDSFHVPSVVARACLRCVLGAQPWLLTSPCEQTCFTAALSCPPLPQASPSTWRPSQSMTTSSESPCPRARCSSVGPSSTTTILSYFSSFLPDSNEPLCVSNRQRELTLPRLTAAFTGTSSAYA